MSHVRPVWRIPPIVARERRHPPGRERIPEPMVMDDPESVAQFHAGGVTNPGQRAVYDFSARALDALLPPGGRLLDLGVGSGRALAALLRRRPDIQVTAVDLAPNMLATARELFVTEGLDDAVELIEADITALPDRLATADWDGVSCVWTLHQLPDFDTLRAGLRQIAALRRNSGAAVWIFRLPTTQRPVGPRGSGSLRGPLDGSCIAQGRARKRGGGIHPHRTVCRADSCWARKHEVWSSKTTAVPSGLLDAGKGRAPRWPVACGERASWRSGAPRRRAAAMGIHRQAVLSSSRRARLINAAARAPCTSRATTLETRPQSGELPDCRS